MILLSTDVKEFWNNNQENTISLIYGVGVAAEFIIEMAEKALVKIDGFMDRDEQKHNHYFNGYNIYSPKTVNEKFKNNKVKIFVSINDTWGAMKYLETNLDIVAEVYLSPYEDNGCSINFGIAPLRNKLLKDKNFTLVANTCAASRIYQITGCEYMTPFVAIIIKPDDYLKICQNLKEYLNKELEFIRYEEWMLVGKYHTLCKLGDIEIKFIGRTDFEKVKTDWETRIKRMNYDNLFLIYENTHYRPSIDFYNKFLEIPYGKKLILQRDVHLFVKNSISTVDYANLFNPGFIIEKWFNLTGFLNHEVEY